MNKEEFERQYPATKGKLVNVLIDKMYEEKLRLLKTFLEESNIFYDDSITNYDELVTYLKKTLTGSTKDLVFERIKAINDTVEDTVAELSKGSTTAFSRFADKVKALIKPLAIGLAFNTAIQLAPGGNIVRLTLFGVSVLYNGYKIIKTNIANKEYVKEINLDKYLRNLELSFSGNKLVDTRFNAEDQEKIRAFLSAHNIPFNDTGYQSLREVIYSLDFDTKLDLVCELTGKDEKERKNFLDNLAHQKKVEDFDKEKNKLFEFLKRNSGVGVKAALATGAPFLSGFVNGLLAKEITEGVFKNEFLAKFSGIAAFIGTLANSNKILVGVESYLLLSFLGSIGKLIKNLFNNVKERKKNSALFEEYARIEGSKYADDDLVENRKVLETYSDEESKGTPYIIIDILIEYLNYLGVDTKDAPRNIDGLTRFLKSDKLNNSQRNKVRSFMKELAYFNEHKNNKFIRNLEKILKGTGTIAVLGLAGMSVYDLISGHTFFNDLYQKLYFEEADVARIVSQESKIVSTRKEAFPEAEGYDVFTFKLTEGENAGLYSTNKIKLQKGADYELFDTVNDAIADSIIARETTYQRAVELLNPINNESLSHIRSYADLMNIPEYDDTRTHLLEIIDQIIEARQRDRMLANQEGLAAAALAAGTGLYNEARKKTR